MSAVGATDVMWGASPRWKGKKKGCIPRLEDLPGSYEMQRQRLGDLEVRFDEKARPREGRARTEGGRETADWGHW